MAKTFASTSDHCDGSTSPVTAMPLSLMVWFNCPGTYAGMRYLTLGATGSGNAYFSICMDFTDGSKLTAVSSKTGQQNQVKTSVAPSFSTWHNALAIFNSISSASIFLDGANKSSGTAVVPDTTVNHTYLSGRNPDHVYATQGQLAQAACWSRALTDIEASYLGSGGNPRAIKGISDYWKVMSSESPIDDQIGVIDLTVTGTTAGTSDPNLQSYMTGGPVGALNYTTGTAIPGINLTAGGGIFDDVSSAFTVTLNQLAAPTQPTTASGTGTTLRVVTVASASAFSPGDYLKVTSSGTPTRVLAVDKTNNLILVANDQTWASSAQIFRFAVTPLSIAGLSMTTNSFGGTPVAAATYANTLFRAACNGNTALVADTELETITITGSGGGGGGSGLLSPAGFFSGGFVGG